MRINRIDTMPSTKKVSLKPKNQSKKEIYQPLNFNGWFSDAKYYFAKALNSRRERIKEEQFKKVEDAVHDDIKFIAARKGISYDMAKEFFNSVLDAVSIPLEKNGNEKGLNKIIGYSYEKYQISKDLLVPLMASDSPNAGSFQIPNGILFYGPKNTGKTHFVRALGEHIQKLELGDFHEVEIYKSDTEDDNPAGLYECFKKAEEEYKKTGKRQVLFIDDFERKINSEKSPNILGVFLYLSRNCSDRGITWIATTNNPKELPDIIFNPSRLNSDINMLAMSDSERSAVMSYAWKKYDRLDDTDHNELINTRQSSNFHFYPPEMQNVAYETDKHLFYNADRRSVLDYRVDIKKPVTTELVKDKIDELYGVSGADVMKSSVLEILLSDDDKTYVQLQRKALNNEN